MKEPCKICNDARYKEFLQKVTNGIFDYLADNYSLEIAKIHAKDIMSRIPEIKNVF